MLAAFVAAQAVFAILRRFIGDTQFIGKAYYPGLLVLAFLFAAKPPWMLSDATQQLIKTFVVVCVIGLLIVSAIPLPLTLNAEQVNEDDTV